MSFESADTAFQADVFKSSGIVLAFRLPNHHSANRRDNREDVTPTSGPKCLWKYGNIWTIWKIYHLNTMMGKSAVPENIFSVNHRVSLQSLAVRFSGIIHIRYVE